MGSEESKDTLYVAKVRMLCRVSKLDRIRNERMRNISKKVQGSRFVTLFLLQMVDIHRLALPCPK